MTGWAECQGQEVKGTPRSQPDGSVWLQKGPLAAVPSAATGGWGLGPAYQKKPSSQQSLWLGAGLGRTLRRGRQHGWGKAGGDSWKSSFLQEWLLSKSVWGPMSCAFLFPTLEVMKQAKPELKSVIRKQREICRHSSLHGT